MVRSSFSFCSSGAAEEVPASEEAGAEPEADGAAEDVLLLEPLEEQAARETSMAAAVIADSARVSLFM